MIAARLSKLRQMVHQILRWILNQMLRMLRCSNRKREADNTQMFKQKKKEAENTVYCCIFCLPILVFLSIILLNFVFFGICVRRSCQPSIQPHIAPINCCIFCLPTLVFLSIILLNFVFFEICVRRSYQPSIQPHIAPIY